jgi:hypothetical protein
MQYLAPILKAIASLFWVAFAFTALLLFRREIAQAIGRIKKGKFLGQEVELSDDLQKLDTVATAAKREVQALPPDESRIIIPDRRDDLNAGITKILQQAVIAPKVALIMLQSELERQAHNAIATRGLLGGRRNISVSEALSQLSQLGLPPYISDALRLFSDVRNKIIHGQAATDDDIIQAIDSGITILKAVSALPRSVNIVYHPSVDIFSDAMCTQVIADAKGLILETTSPDGAVKGFQIVPITMTRFQKGREVTLEYNLNRVWPETWYRDPDSEEIKHAWREAAEFIGRHLDDI